MAKGYTKIENSLFDFMISGEVKGAELEVLWFLIRYSKGFKRDTARASYGFMAKGLNCSIDKVKRAVKKLIAKGYISIEYPANGNQAQIFKIAYANLHTSCVQNSTDSVGQNAYEHMGDSAHQDIKKDIINKTLKNKEKASPQNLTSFLPCETSLMREMSDEDRARYLALLPKELLERDPDDYTDEEWDIYDDWRVSNGLI